MQMDLLSFGAALRCVLQRAQQDIYTSTINMRVATQGGEKAWKQWLKNMEDSMQRKKLGPGEFQAAFAVGAFNRGSTKSRGNTRR